MAAVTHRENWSEHQTTMFSSLHEKQKQGKFCDVVLKCCDSDQTFNAHSCVLSAASTVLDEMLSDAMEMECLVPGTTKLLVVLPDDVTSPCINSLLNFIYSGNIDLDLKNPKAASTPSTRKSKRHSSKARLIEEEGDRASPDIPLLYAFLKASRRLEIQTLTEHLESAVTLSEMKMSDLRDSSVNKTLPAKKAKVSSKVNNNFDENDHHSKENKSGKKKQNIDQSGSAISKTGMSTRQKRARHLGKSSSEERATATPEKDQKDDESRKTRLKSSQQLSELKETKSGANTGLTRTSTGNQIEEKPDAVSANKTRVIKKLQCPTCQKVFKRTGTYEAHMKNHINEIERELSVSRNRCKNSPGDSKNATSVIFTNGDKICDEFESTAKLSNIRSLSERPKRASTARFHEMMKSTFGADHDVIISPKTKATPVILDNEVMQSNDVDTIVLTEIDGKNINVISDEEVDQQIVYQDATIEEELVVVEPQRTEWQPVEHEISLNTIDGIEEQDVMVGATTTLSFVPVSIHEDVETTVKKSGGKGKKKKVKSPICDESQICSECGKAVSNMKAHLRTHSRAIACQICGDNFKYKSALNRHMQFHSGGMLCNICDQRLFSQRAMTRHMATHNLKKMRTECPDCKKSFTSEYVMQLHRRTHTGQEKFSCEVCSKRFPYKSSLKMHMLLHTGEKPYICSICGKCFVQKIHAKEHEMQHQGIKRQFECNICLKHFAHKCGLTRHVADIHNKSRPFVCDVCGKSFPRKTKLIEHTRMHTGEKPYICEICGMRYKANRSLKCHKKSEHGIFVPDYEVGIWRKGTMPPMQDNEKKKNAAKRKSKSNIASKNGSISRSLYSFPFPISSEEMNVPAQGDNLVNVMTGEQLAANENLHPSNGKASQHFSYPIPQTNQTFHEQLTAMTDVTSYTAQTLPPACTLTKSDSSSPLEYPAFNTQKTFIVPLTSGAHPSVPVVVDPNPSPIDQTQVSGMMVTYMMPPQPYTIAEGAVSNDPNSDVPASRSASVPPMSTFSRASNSVGSQGPDSPVQTLPGMHTFQPTAQFRVTSNDINTEILEMETPEEMQTITEGHQILPVSPAEEVPALAEEVTVQQHSEDWSMEEYSS